MTTRGGTVEEKIRELFAGMLQADPAEINDATTPERVERWDSMQHLILVAGFEEEFGVDVDPEEAVDMYTDFCTFKRVVLEKLGARN
jgi:acyl carrier protein